jgi:hypothetical protein
VGSKTLVRAIRAIEEHGVLLVYPVQNRREPLSLWHVLHPRSAMRWAWDDAADDRVVELWHLRAELAASRKVVYSKWLGGRATFFSRELFRSLLATLRVGGRVTSGLSKTARELLELLEDDSPRGTAALRAHAGLEGRVSEPEFSRSMRELWERLLIVGAGECEEGGFPSLAAGATLLLFEDLWVGAETLRPEDVRELERAKQSSPSFARAWTRLGKKVAGSVAPVGRFLRSGRLL